MELTVSYIESAFDKYNELYFNGSLEKPNFKITKGKRQLGCLSIRRECNLAYYNSYFKIYTLSVSNYYNRTEKQYDNTIIHEMIHLYIDQNNIIDNGSHGRHFKAECARINKYGWNLSRCTDTKGWELSEYAKKKEERKNENVSYNIIVYKEVNNGSQFFVKVSKPNVYRYLKHLRYKCNLECKFFTTNDTIFKFLPNCTKKIRGKRIYENDKTSEFAKYMI